MLLDFRCILCFLCCSCQYTFFPFMYCCFYILIDFFLPDLVGKKGIINSNHRCTDLRNSPPDLLSFDSLPSSLYSSTKKRQISYNKKMGVTKEEVETTLTSALKPTHLEVIDTSGGCGASFEVEIVSEQFEGKRLLERHRLVNTALAEQMKQIHALSIKKALTPAQWKPEDKPQE
ncbi:Bola-like family protein [Rhynchospora pubera]|nr:Bola-like family protein [Rhynchospora pubera]